MMQIENIVDFKVPEYGRYLSITFYQFLLQQTQLGHLQWEKIDNGYKSSLFIKFPGQRGITVYTILEPCLRAIHNYSSLTGKDSLDSYGFTTDVIPDKNKYGVVLDELYRYLEQTLF